MATRDRDGPPCSHNSWDNVRIKKGAATLRCRECQHLWRAQQNHLDRCPNFLNNSCLRGSECTKVHIHQYKESLKDRFERFGHKVLERVPRVVQQQHGIEGAEGAQQHASSAPLTGPVPPQHHPHEGAKRMPEDNDGVHALNDKDVDQMLAARGKRAQPATHQPCGVAGGPVDSMGSQFTYPYPYRLPPSSTPSASSPSHPPPSSSAAHFMFRPSPPIVHPEGHYPPLSTGAKTPSVPSFDTRQQTTHTSYAYQSSPYHQSYPYYVQQASITSSPTLLPEASHYAKKAEGDLPMPAAGALQQKTMPAWGHLHIQPFQHTAPPAHCMSQVPPVPLPQRDDEAQTTHQKMLQQPHTQPQHAPPPPHPQHTQPIIIPAQLYHPHHPHLQPCPPASHTQVAPHPSPYPATPLPSLPLQQQPSPSKPHTKP
eukprot:Sspe_Gene.19628::Locus_7166_Transcript_1_1_Confidence_1.000_Length_1406::g.19628::m.19628